jgi:hypothetical protein
LPPLFDNITPAPIIIRKKEAVILDIVHEILDADIDVRIVDPQEFSPEDLLN